MNPTPGSAGVLHCLAGSGWGVLSQAWVHCVALRLKGRGRPCPDVSGTSTRKQVHSFICKIRSQPHVLSRQPLLLAQHHCIQFCIWTSR